MGVMPTAFATLRIVTASAPSRRSSPLAALKILSAVDLRVMSTVYTTRAYTPYTAGSSAWLCFICPAARGKRHVVRRLAHRAALATALTLDNTYYYDRLYLFTGISPEISPFQRYAHLSCQSRQLHEHW